ncbi:MAG: transposase [Gammaproteobacteria bacterium]|nr:transposase [Gammaproteobacteria bacterium]
MKNPKLAWAYSLTLRTYNTWVHGDPRLSVDPRNNIFNTPKIAPMPPLKYAMENAALEEPLILNLPQRETVLKSIVETCDYNHWKLLAAHVRTNHMHIILQSEKSKEQVMGKIKCYATKDLKKSHDALSQRENFWSRHGSTKNVWMPEEIFPWLYYVVRQQGKQGGLYYDKAFYDQFDERLYESYFGG